MQLLELLANKHKMQFMMLTVFKNNDGAMRNPPPLPPAPAAATLPVAAVW